MSQPHPKAPNTAGGVAHVSDATLREFLGYHMKRAFNVVQADLARVLKPFELRMLTYSALVLIVPLLLPVAIGYGIDPVHLGIVFLANMQIGYFTPPVGMNLFIASYRFRKPITRLYRATLSWFLILLGAVLLITYWPWLSLALGRG